MEWKSSMFDNNMYNFDYDGVNRIYTAEYSGTGNHNTSYGYDLNGNLLTLSREGKLGGSSNYALIDELVYTYLGNQLESVNDIDDSDHQNNGFSDDGSFASTEYAYDVNGNMIIDANKSMQVYEYNYLNLPQQLNIFTSGTNEINYLYDAAGIKLRKQTRTNYTVEKTLDYIGSFVYEDDGNFELRYILTGEGRVMVNSNGTYEYQYFLKDHLGNTRVIFNENGEVIQEDAYYPFGMQMNGLCYETGLDYKNKYLYNGKELQDEFGLDWYDYGARFYDAQIGRWHVPDMLADEAPSWSPFRYGFNNPISFTDPTGMFEDWYEDENKNMVYDENIKTQDDLDATGIKGTYLGEEGYGINEETGQAIHYQKDGTIREFTQTFAETTVTSDGVVYLSKNSSISSNNQTGYTYNERDLRVRSKIINSSSPIGRYLRSQESKGIFWILNAYDYWNYYGHILGNMILIDQYIMMADMISSGDPSVKVSTKARGFNVKPTSSSKAIPCSFLEFLKMQKGKNIGKYSGRGEWMKQQAIKYNKLKR